MFRRVIPAVALATVMALVAGCASESNDDLFVDSQGDDSSSSASSGGEPQTPGTADEVADAAITDVQTYWEETFPDVYGSSFEPLAEGFHAYNSNDLPPPCGGQQPPYEMLAQNAFYCDLDDYIAWDEEGLLPWLEEDFGLFTIAIVLAHEFGHAIQQRASELDHSESVRVEMQADCYAGAWTGWVADGNGEHFEVNVDQLDEAIAGLLAFRDLPGSSPEQIGAHGAGFDRVGAFQDGFEDGAERCADYSDPDGLPPVTQIPFTPTDIETEGNMPLEDAGDDLGLFTHAEAYLDYYFDQVFETRLGEDWSPVEGLEVVDPARDEVTCDGETLSGEDDLRYINEYCSEENVAVFDGGTLGPEMHSELGDFAVAAELSQVWATAAQEQLDIDPTTKESRLQADCLTGNWAAALWPDLRDGSTYLGDHPDEEIGPITLSAGDLDEAVLGFLAFRRARTETHGNVFERIAAFRSGFYEQRGAIEACEEIQPLA